LMQYDVTALKDFALTERFKLQLQGQFFNLFNNKDNRGPSGFDVRHRFVATHNWEIPFFRNSSNAVLKAVLGGWALNGIYQWQSGLPIGLLSGARTGYSQFPDPLFLGGGGAQRPNLVGPLNLSLGPDPGTGAQNPNKVTNSGLAQPFLGNFGTLGRNVVRQNGLMQYDVTALKDFALTERFKLQLQGQFFNLFNNIGYYQDTATNTRNITLVLRLMF
ncbi:MAG: hypothetical protein MUC42_11920, partial [Bryobacter sp.]|nr:hypothetical protein [Bryobacter sp.]